jgi:hypothetical protein
MAPPPSSPPHVSLASTAAPFLDDYGKRSPNHNNDHHHGQHPTNRLIMRSRAAIFVQLRAHYQRHSFSARSSTSSLPSSGMTRSASVTEHHKPLLRPEELSHNNSRGRGSVVIPILHGGSTSSGRASREDQKALLMEDLWQQWYHTLMSWTSE